MRSPCWMNVYRICAESLENSCKEGSMGNHRDNLFWDVCDLEFEDLPTLQELFADADKKLLIDLIFKLATRRESNVKLRAKFGKKRRRRIRKRLEASLGDMLHVKVRKSKKWCLFPFMLIDEERREYGLPVSVRAECVRRSDFPLAKAVVDVGAGAPDVAMPQTYSITHDTWEKVLGFRVWLGGCASRLERYLFLVDAFWEMTFFGYRKKAHDKNLRKEAKRLKKSLAELENGKAKAVSLEVFKKRMGMANYGLGDDAPSLEDEFCESA